MPGRVLVLDTDVTNRLTVKTALSAESFDVITTDKENDVVRTVLREQADVVILSARLRTTNGYNLCWRLKQNPLSANIPVIILAGSNDLNWKRGLGSRADDLVPLPFNRFDLAERIHRLNRQKSEIDALRLHAQTQDHAGFHEAAWQAPNDRLGKTDVVILSQNLPLAKSLAQNVKTDLQSDVFFIEHIDQLPPAKQASLLILLDDKPFSDPMLDVITTVKSSPQLRDWPIMTVTTGQANAFSAQSIELGCAENIFGLENTARVSMRARSLLWATDYISKLRKASKARTGSSAVDPLTGLYNAKYAIDYVERAIGWQRTDGNDLVALMLSLDNFKQVNDTMGHPTGEAVLREFAGLLKSHIQGIDVMARMGGSKFLLAIPNVADNRAAYVAERIRQLVLSTRFCSFDGRSATRLTLSAGLSSTSSGLQNSAEILEAAEFALRKAETGGRNQVAFFSQLAA